MGNADLLYQIGKTSAVVLTLSGVLKDILLVVASMIIFQSEVTWVQAIGYSIALGGLIYYKVGAEQLQSSMSDARARFASYSQKNPSKAKLAIVGGILALITIIAFASWPYIPAKFKTSPF